MKNPNSPWNRIKRSLRVRWSGEDYPGAEPRFQITLLGKDLAIFVLLPTLAVVLFKSCETSMNAPKRPSQQPREVNRNEGGRSQVIVFSGSSGTGQTALSAPKRAPGTLVRLQLMNLVETYANAPVHAQIVDASLGKTLTGGTLIGDATADSNYERINITFRYARDPSRSNIAFPISARALGLDGTMGLVARKKEGAFTRAVFAGGSNVSQDSQSKMDSLDLKDIVVKALTAGLLQEVGNTSQVERNRAQVLTLQPPAEFFAELTDYFPGAAR